MIDAESWNLVFGTELTAESTEVDALNAIFGCEHFIARDRPNGVLVSTVNQTAGPASIVGPEIIEGLLQEPEHSSRVLWFEVYRGDTGVTERFRTREEALAKHAQIVAELGGRS